MVGPGLPISTLLSLFDADHPALPELPPNRYFDDLATVDELLEHSSPVRDRRSDVSASLYVSTLDASNLRDPSRAPSQNHAPTTDEIVQLILINEVQAAEDRLDADRRALERKAEVLEEAWRAEKLTLDQERWIFAGEKQNLAQRELDLCWREKSLQENMDKLQKEEAIFRQQRDEYEQEQQGAKTQKLRELIWAASEEELAPILNILLLRLGTRGSSADILEQTTRRIILPRLLRQPTPLAATDMLHNHVLCPAFAAILERHLFPRPATDQAEMGTQSLEEHVNAATPAFTFRAGPSPCTTPLKLHAASTLNDASHSPILPPKPVTHFSTEDIKNAIPPRSDLEEGPGVCRSASVSKEAGAYTVADLFG
ncbi:hypothetical protein G647_08615 [Cladophialophora carrionii CBS 160.54]|uniref:Uncharacterized protein n=1 Tax=Cladophialophora carrionii CBS 160.54 TaxID=1279043 RepID=V9D2R0_9EURO|nr:uncharacterized protein G647_08615 [Cladophialophora carrionii CBS 160.54]ETI20578.1 hypothetical protein G647_08615 [Cladophialophora carrionii CBS 160.54]